MKASMIAAAVTLFAAGAAQAAAVRVTVSKVGPKGDLMVQLCSEAEYNRGCKLHARVAPHAGVTTVDFPSVAPGAYVAAVIQDVDGNGRLSFGMTGAPSEPWGYSRAAKAVMGPAAFKDAVVSVGPGSTDVPVTLGR